MNDSIKLHPEYGLNPTLATCIICGEETGEIAFLGANYKGEAPKNMVLTVKPCEKCHKKYLTKGVLLVEAEEKQVRKHLKRVPTGLITVIRNEAFKTVFQQDIPKDKIVFVEVGILQLLKEQSQRADEADKGRA